MSNTCRRCHKVLTREQSIVNGFGPVCWKKQLKDVESMLPLETSMEYTGGDIICKRVSGVIATNIPHRLTYHSPSGYEWGYAGSGPADLALNILMMFTDKNTAFSLHQEFKFKYVAGLPFEGGTIKKADIDSFLKENAVLKAA